MRRSLTIAGLAAVITASLLAASVASAAVEFGDGCAADGVAPPEEGGYTLTTLSAPGGALPLTAPSAGVITKLKMQNAIPFPFAVPTSVKALRSAGGNNYTVVGQTTVSALPGLTSGLPGLTVADARIPVQAGDRLGLHGQPFTYEGSPVPSLSLYCEGSGDGSTLGAAKGDVPPGSTAEFVGVTEGRVPLAAILEPDADNDGFGDETQDKCPQNATVQVPCPVVALSTSASAKKGLANVLVTSSFQAPVTVAGTVNLGKGKSAKLSGGTQIVTPGVIAKFTLLFPQKLKAKLKQLNRKRFLWLNLTSTAPNVVGPPTVSGLKVKLKGQAKPKAKKPQRQAKS